MKPYNKFVWLAATALTAVGSFPAMAQTADEDVATSGNDIIVSARRVEERL